MKGLLYVDDLEDTPAAGDAQQAPTPQDDLLAVLCLEIGGANSMTALVEGGESGKPVLDADTMGRAFPELQVKL